MRVLRSHLGYFLRRREKKFSTGPFSNPTARYADLKNSIAVYPEVVAGNPLGSRKVVRWFLHRPGFHTRQIEYGTGELYFFYHEVFNDPSLNPCGLDTLGIGARVAWHGWLNEEKISRVLRESRALIVPSIWPEPAALVILEGMAHARAIIGSGVGGTPGIVDDCNSGLLVPSGDERGLAQAMDLLARDYDLAQKMGEIGRRLAAAQFSLDGHLERLDQICGAVGRKSAQLSSRMRLI